MTELQRIKNLQVPEGKIDVVLDTDAYNEIDDQFAISYLLRSNKKCNVKEIYAAPFHNENSTSAGDGMERSYHEIFKILNLAGIPEGQIPVYRGSTHYLTSETEPVQSPAAQALIDLAQAYTTDSPLYVVAIGAITNIASALILDPTLKERIVLVWLGGHSLESPNTLEFNMFQDVAAARIVFGCGVPLVQLPCGQIVEAFTVSGPELEKWFMDKNPLSDYLARNTIQAAEKYAHGHAWTRTIWDVTAVAWLLNEDDCFMRSHLIQAPIPEYDNHYAFDNQRHMMRYVSWINRDALLNDLIEKLTK